MIHLFDTCKKCCTLPGKACTECGKVFDNINCSACEQCCEEVHTSFKGFLQKPLSTYAVLAVAISAGEIGLVVASIYEPSLQDCTFPKGLGQQVGAYHWLYGQFGFAWLNLTFAPYIRHRLWLNLQDASQKVAAEGGAAWDGTTAKVPQTLVREAFSNVFWHDIGVCMYVFASVASLWWSFNGLDWVEASDACDPGGFASMAAMAGSAFFFFLVVYFACFWLYLKCGSAMEVTPVGYLLPGAAAAVMASHGPPPGAQQGRPPAGGGGFNFLGGDKPQEAGAGHAGPSAPPLPPRMSATQRAFRPAQLFKLLMCLLLDAGGDASYFFPGLGEGVDMFYAPGQAVALMTLFSSRRVAIIGFLEEALPFSDILPTATIAWFMEISGVFDVVEEFRP